MNVPTEILESIFVLLDNINDIFSVSKVCHRFNSITNGVEFIHEWTKKWCKFMNDPENVVQFQPSFSWTCKSFKCIPEADTFSWFENPDSPAYVEGAIKAYQTNNRDIYMRFRVIYREKCRNVKLSLYKVWDGREHGHWAGMRRTDNYYLELVENWVPLGDRKSFWLGPDVTWNNAPRPLIPHGSHVLLQTPCSDDSMPQKFYQIGTSFRTLGQYSSCSCFITIEPQYKRQNLAIEHFYHLAAGYYGVTDGQVFTFSFRLKAITDGNLSWFEAKEGSKDREPFIAIN